MIIFVYFKWSFKGGKKMLNIVFIPQVIETNYLTYLLLCIIATIYRMVHSVNRKFLFAKGSLEVYLFIAKRTLIYL